MKGRLIILVFLFIASSIKFSFALSESEAIKIYHEANMTYQKLDYEKSIMLYEQLVKHNSVSTEVYYNLGNAYFKSGNFSKAILNYERAKKIEPDDEDIAFNLKIASLKVVDKIETVPEVFYKKWINQFSLLLPANTWSIILIFLVWLLFAAIAYYFLGRTVVAKKLAFVFILIFIFLTGTCAVMASRSHAIASVDEQAIIMTSSVYVKSSPDEKGNDLFILHEGTKVDVLDQLNNWKKIRIANGSIGWMKADEMEKI